MLEPAGRPDRGAHSAELDSRAKFLRPPHETANLVPFTKLCIDAALHGPPLLPIGGGRQEFVLNHGWAKLSSLLLVFADVSRSPVS